jgi:phage tail tape-measure protein
MSEDTGRATGVGTSIGLGAGAVAGAGVALSGALAGTKFGAALGSAAGPIGTAIGAVAGTIIGAAVGVAIGSATEASETERETAAMDKLVAAYEIEGESVFETGRLEELLGEENAELAAALRENEQETRELVRQMATANELEKVANTQRAQ